MAKTIRGGERATDRPRKLFIQVFGVEGVGKTSFALSFPPPLWIVNLDRNMDDLLEKLPADYEVHYEGIPYDVDMNRSVAAQTVMKVEALLKEAITAGTGTFILDGADLYWEYVKTAKLPDDADLPNQWGPANSTMASLYRRLETSPLQVVTTSIASKVWEGAKKETDKMKPDGFKHTGRFITGTVYLFTPEDHTQPLMRPPERKSQSHHAYISLSKLNESIVGSVVPNLSYKLLYRMIFGQLPPDADKLWSPSAKPVENTV